jgi:hypothetical protein
MRLASKTAGEMRLAARLMAHFRLNNLSDFSIDLDYLDRDFAKYQETINEVVEVMADEAYDGNSFCHQKFVDAANALSGSTKSSIERLGIRDEPFPIGLVGSTWKTGDLLVRPFLNQVMEYAPLAYVQDDAKEPAHAAALMALQKFG